MKERLFTTEGNKTQIILAEKRKNAYGTIINQIAVLNPESLVLDNPRFDEDTARSLFQTPHVSQYETHLGFTELKATGGRNMPEYGKVVFSNKHTLSGQC